MSGKKGSKAFGLLVKLFGKRLSKEALIAQATSALDTNGDKKITIDDFAKGKWRDINWLKLAGVVLMAGLALAATFIYGIAVL